jgi:DNA-binding XRE family transcriptional regulator
LSNFVAKWRNRWGLSQEQAAQKLGVTDRTIRNYEKKLPLIAKYAMLYLNIKWGNKIDE